MGARVHCVPSQCSASMLLKSMNLPPAVQTSLDETAVTDTSPPEPVLGLGITLQLLPFQCKVSGFWELSLPTAQISLGEIAVSPARPPVPGLDTTLQLFPFQC